MEAERPPCSPKPSEKVWAIPSPPGQLRARSRLWGSWRLAPVGSTLPRPAPKREPSPEETDTAPGCHGLRLTSLQTAYKAYRNFGPELLRAAAGPDFMQDGGNPGKRADGNQRRISFRSRTRSPRPSWRLWLQTGPGSIPPLFGQKVSGRPDTLDHGKGSPAGRTFET